MRSWGVLCLLGSLCAVWHLAHGQCDLSNKKEDLAFPDLEKEGIESYQMSVEYTLKDAKQTDYFVEYYDILERRGRIEAHQAGDTVQYIYRTATWEAWDITGRKCSLMNITEISEMFKDDQTDWMYIPGEKYDRRTIGPSAMFKIALDDWNAKDDKNIKMNFMGKSENLVRGLEAFYWRRCDSKTSYVDYFFTTDDEENPYGLESLRRFPLRVSFGGKRTGREAKLANQQYEIMDFQPYISTDVKPFELPVGRECKRNIYLPDAPEVPNFLNNNLMLGAEVIYRKVDRNGEGVKFWSYFSTLSMALDRGSQHLAYSYTPWDQSTKKDDEPKAKAPEHIIYDMKHGYMYKYSLDDGQCTIGREKSFEPKFALPEDAGAISLTDPTILFPNGNMYYITKGTVRGLRVNIFEETVEGYLLDKGNDKIQIPKAVISHAYLQDDEVEMSTGSTKNALVQVQMRFSGREDNVFEVLTLNFFGFSTNLRRRRNLFNIKRCFKNDDDYVWVKLGFDADPNVLKKIQNDIPSIEANILGAITARSELNPVRIPIVQVDFKDALIVELMVLEKPPVMLDYEAPKEDTAILGSTEVEGVLDINTCAKRCLETEVNCWGFSICGAVCAFGAGTATSAKTGPKKGCMLYNRYNNEAFIPSNELMIQGIRSEIAEHLITLVLFDKDGEKYQLEASSIEVTDPGEDDRTFNRIGNTVNPRLRVLKVGYKLDDKAGTSVKNLGKLRFDACQSLCLDFKTCETVSYCIDDSSCILTKTYGEEIPSTDFKENNLCEVLAVKYSDHFNRSPGNVLTVAAQEVLKLDTAEKCARACLKQTEYQCKSFDHCPTDADAPCKLHVLHYPNSKTREPVQTKSSNCGHYYRKYSTEFKMNPEKRVINSKVPALTNLTLEECSKSCMEYGNGTCYGFDFCQDTRIFATSCVIFDSDVTKMKTTYSPVCSNYFRTEVKTIVKLIPKPPKPYSNGYAAGIGILCFVVGGIVGVVIVFGIAYLKVNRR